MLVDAFHIKVLLGGVAFVVLLVIGIVHFQAYSLRGEHGAREHHSHA